MDLSSANGKELLQSEIVWQIASVSNLKFEWKIAKLIAKIEKLWNAVFNLIFPFPFQFVSVQLASFYFDFCHIKLALIAADFEIRSNIFKLRYSLSTLLDVNLTWKIYLIFIPHTYTHVWHFHSIISRTHVISWCCDMIYFLCFAFWLGNEENKNLKKKLFLLFVIIKWRLCQLSSLKTFADIHIDINNWNLTSAFTLDL